MLRRRDTEEAIKVLSDKVLKNEANCDVSYLISFEYYVVSNLYSTKKLTENPLRTIIRYLVLVELSKWLIV